MEPLGALQHRHRRIDDARSLRDALRYEFSSSRGHLYQLPDERELSKKLGCSRNALRVALNLLRDEHLIERRQGSGTHVVGGSSSLFPSETQSLMNIIDGPNRVRYQMLETKVVTAAGAIAELLGVVEGEPILVISRLTVVDGLPTCLWDTFISEAKGLPLVTAPPSLDFFEMLHEALGIETTVIAMRVEAVVADESVTELLQIAIGQPLLRYERVTSDDAGNVIALSFGRARADRVAMVVSGHRTITSTVSSSKTADPETADPETADPETADPETADPETADPETADPETADPETAGSKTVTSGTVSAVVADDTDSLKVARSKGPGSKVAGSKVAGSKVAGSKVAGSKVAGSKVVRPTTPGVNSVPIITSPFGSDPVSAIELEVQLS